MLTFSRHFLENYTSLFVPTHCLLFFEKVGVEKHLLMWTKPIICSGLWCESSEIAGHHELYFSYCFCSGTIAALLQEIVNIYPMVNPPNLTVCCLTYMS